MNRRFDNIAMITLRLISGIRCGLLFTLSVNNPSFLYRDVIILTR